MNKTDLAFYVSSVAVISAKLAEIVSNASPVTLVDWVVVVLGGVSVICYALYEKLTAVK